MSGTPEQPRILTGQRVPTRDGVDLATDVFLPPGGGAHPAVVLRTPYGRTAPYLLRLAVRLGREGLATVLQDCRGRNGSGGEADWRREEADGRDTLAWLADRPWCDRRVGLLGISIGSLAVFPLAAAPPAGVEVRALVNVMGAADLRSFFYRGGALVLHWALPWLHLMARRETARGVKGDRPWDELYAHLPLVDVPSHGGFDAELWRSILTQPDGGEVWRGLDATDRLRDLPTPVLHVGGWSDFLLAPTLETHRHTAGRGDAVTRLVVGPWDHASLFAGDELLEILAAWYGRWLGVGARGGAGAAGEGAEVLLRVPGSPDWLGFDRFPPSRSRPLDLYLTSGGAADSAGGDGALVTAAPQRGGVDRYTYDPTDPVPTVGGSLWPFPAAGLQPGPADVSRVEARGDVLVYTGPPLADDLWIAGPARLELWATSSAPATDFTARLVDVDADGVPRVVQDGVVRLPETDAGGGGTSPRPVDIHLSAVGHRFQRGHRVRLEVSSSNFPQYDRHLNRASTPACTADPAVAEQSVHHGGDTPSRLCLTTLDSADFAACVTDLTAALRGRRRHRASLPRRLLRRSLTWPAALGRRLGAVIETQTAKPTGAVGWLVGRLLLFTNRRLNRWTTAALDVEPTDRVLEIGFGPGATVRRLSRWTPRGRVAGIDHSPVMVAQARRRNRRAVRRGRVDLRQGEVSRLPFDDDAFDKAVAVNSVQLWPRPVEDLIEVRRVLRPGGRLVLSFAQPRWGVNEASMRAVGQRTTRQLTTAGFTLVGMEFRRLGLLYGFRAVARAPAG